MNLIFGRSPKLVPRKKYDPLWDALRERRNDPSAWVGIELKELKYNSPALARANIRSAAHREDLAVDVVVDGDVLFVRISPGSKSLRPAPPPPPAPAAPPMAPKPVPPPPAPSKTPSQTTDKSISANKVTSNRPSGPKLTEVEQDRLMGLRIEEALDLLATMEPGEVVELDLGPRSDKWSVYHREASVTARQKGLKVSTDRSARELIIQLTKVPESSPSQKRLQPGSQFQPKHEQGK